MKKKRSQDEEDFIVWVKSLGCYLTQATGRGYEYAEFHHVEGRGFENCDYLGIPIKQDFHTGTKNGWHGERLAWKLANETDMKALAWVIKQLWLENKTLRESQNLIKMFGM